MRITIFGASGIIGKLVVKKALDAGYKVNAYIRNPLKFDLKHKNLEVSIGELDDYAKIRGSIQGSDTVISTLGPPLVRRYDEFSILEGHSKIIIAMEDLQIKRFITIATPSIKFNKDIPSLLTKLPSIMAQLFLPDAYQEIVEIGHLIRESNLDWTIVRIIAPNNKHATGLTKVSFGDRKIKFSISREDIADFLLNQITDKEHIRSMPIIGN